VRPAEHRDLAQIERDLAEVRRQIALRAGSGLPAGSQENRTALTQGLLAVVLLPFAAIPLLLAVLNVAEGDAGGAVVLAVVGLPFGWLLVRAGRRSLAAFGRSDLDLLRRQERALVVEADAALRVAGPAGFGEVRPLPVDRQPTGYAQLMHARFRLGPSPEEALRALPPGAPAWRVAFHRYVGWGTVPPAVLAAGLLGARVLAG
jgi:hypothetical protein